MKKRSMILALASMLGISAAATAVSGFAWFTTQTTSNVAEHAYKVGAAQGDLLITRADKDINCTSALNDNTKELTITHTTDAPFADVSSVDGENFYKLRDLNTTTNTADLVTENGAPAAGKGAWVSKVNSTQMVAVSWTVTVANGGGQGTSMDVYLSHNGALFTDAKTSGTESYVDAYRLAIFNNGSLVYFYGGAVDSDSNPIKSGIDGTEIEGGTTEKYDYTNYQWDGNGFTHNIATTAHTINSRSDVAASDTAKVGSDTSAVTNPSSQLLAEGLAGATTNPTAQTLKFVVWCEGTLTPEAAVNAGNQVKLSLSLVGLAAVNA